MDGLFKSKNKKHNYFESTLLPTHKAIHSQMPHNPALQPKNSREYRFLPQKKNYFLKFPALPKKF